MTSRVLPGKNPAARSPVNAPHMEKNASVQDDICDQDRLSDVLLPSGSFRSISVFPGPPTGQPGAAVAGAAPFAIQRKLALGSVDDPLEREADSVADEVVRMPGSTSTELPTISPNLQRKCSCGSSPDGECETCGTEKEGALKRGPSSFAHAGFVPPVVDDVLRSAGHPLDPEARMFFESRLHHDFSRIRIHADSSADRSARSIGALAYTVGSDVVFAAGRYQPGTGGGRLLLAHELAHVVQQDYEAPRTLRCKPDDQSNEEQEREKLLAEFTDGAGLSDKRLHQIKRAMEAFSLHQLHAMRKAGVRFWPGDSLPPEFEKEDVQARVIGTPAEYLSPVRVIRMAEKTTTDEIRHELAHAWDHVRTGKVQTLAHLKGKALIKAIEQTAPLLSETGAKRATKEEHGGKVRAVRLTMSEMLKRYRQWKLREMSFDNPSTREGYSKTSEREFYAEGYSVFHSGNESNQARLLYFAPELYELLEAEAKEEGLPVPDRSRLEAQIKEQKLPPP